MGLFLFLHLQLLSSFSIALKEGGSLLGKQVGLLSAQLLKPPKASLLALALQELLGLASLSYVAPKREMSRVPLSMGFEQVPEALQEVLEPAWTVW